MLVDGVHFARIKKNSDVLVVSYAPVNLPLGQLPHFKRLEPLNVDRLTINPGTNNFYQDAIESVETLVNSISAEYRKVIHIGYSAGAYAALRFGSGGVNSQAVFAISPHINLKRPFTRSSMLSSVFSKAEQDWDLTTRLNKAACEDIHIFYSCSDLMDGVQVQDSKNITSPSVKHYYYDLPHELYGVNEPQIIIEDYINTGTHKTLQRELLSSIDTQNDSITAYHLYCNIRVGAKDFNKNDLTIPVSSKCGILSFMQARALETIECFMEANLKYAEAAILLLGKQYNMGDLYFCMGNNFMRIGVEELAFGAYRESMRWDWRNVESHKVYAREAARRHRFFELQSAIDTHRKLHGDTMPLAAMETEYRNQMALAVS